MSDDFLNVLARHMTGDQLAALGPVAQELEGLSVQLAAVLGRLEGPAVKQELLAQVETSVLASLKSSDSPPPAATPNGDAANPAPWPPFESEPITPELREWLLQQFNEEELAASLREVRETGGLELHEFIHELEQAAGIHD